MCLQARHIRMWDIIENGPSLIYGEKVQIEGESPGEATFKQVVKSPRKYTAEERLEASLDNYAKALISSTVKGVHLAKIRNLQTAKEMWDTLKSLSIGSEESQENKLSMACNNFNEFKMLPGETVEQMRDRFMKITLEIAAIKKDKFTQRELNLKVIRALPASWHVYVALHPNRPDFNKLTTEELFDILMGNEYEIIRIHGSAPACSNKGSKAKKKWYQGEEKDAAFRADLAKDVPPNLSKEFTRKDELLQDLAMMTRKQERLESRMLKYKQFYRENKHRVGKHNLDRSD